MNAPMYERGLRMLETAIETLDAAGSVTDIVGADIVRESATLEARLSMLRDEMGRRSATALEPASRGWPSPAVRFAADVADQLLGDPGKSLRDATRAAVERALPQGERPPRRRRKGGR